MAEQSKGYLIGEGVRQKLRATFARVDAMPLPGGKVPIPTDLSYYPPTIASHYLAKTTELWVKGTSQTLTAYSGTPGSEEAVSLSEGDGATHNAWNKTGGDVEADKFVLLARANGTLYLAEPEVVEQTVLTGASLGTAGLVFTRETLYVVGKKTTTPSAITISTTTCAST